MTSTLSQPEQQGPKILSQKLKDPLQQAFIFNSEELIQEPLDKYAIAFQILDYGDLEDAKTCWLEAEKSAKRNGDQTLEFKCKGRRCVLEICHFKNMEEGKRMAEEMLNKYPGWTFFAIMKALAQETEDEFRMEFSKIPDYVMKKVDEEQLDVFQRDWERAQKMLESGNDKEHWEKIAGRYHVIVKKIEAVILSKRSWRSNVPSAK